VFGSSLKSGAESACDGGRCTSSPIATGFVGLLRGGYEIPARVSALIGVGYLSVRRTIERDIATTFGPDTDKIPVAYAMTDRLRVAGPMVTAGVGYRVPFGRFELGARLHIGFAFVGASDGVDGRATVNGRSADVYVDDAGKSVRTIAVLGIPEIHAAVRFGAIDVRLGVMALASVATGARLDNGQTHVAADTKCTPAIGREVECAPGTFLVANERAFGRFLLIAPEIAVGWTF